MAFEFSEDQQLIRQQVADVLSKLSTPLQLRQLLDAERGGSGPSYDRALWQQATELGWTAIRIPEAHGGMGLGYLELAVVAEEVGRALAAIPFSSSVYLATEALMLAGSEQQQSDYLPALAAGELIGCLAMNDIDTVAAADVTAELNCHVVAGHLTGCKLPVADGDIADFAVLLAADEAGSSLYLVDLKAAGVSRQTLKTLDPTRSHARLDFDAVAVQRLGELGQGGALLMQLLDIAAVLTAFEQVGGAQACLDMGIDYCKNRYAFGRQVASFQAIKHKFADMFTALELARANAYSAVWALVGDDTEFALAAATARVAASDAYYLCSKENIQNHGGMGFTWEFDCHLYYRRAQLLSMNLGGQGCWRERLATQLLASPKAGAVALDFAGTQEQQQFRRDVRQWLQANGTAKRAGEMPAMKPAGSAGTVNHVEAQAWYKKKFDAGFACLSWPKEYGGAGLSAIEQIIWNQEMAGYSDPDTYFFIGQGNCGPAIMNFADEETKLALMPRMASAEDIWCQLFSEPGAGSDIAGLATKAVQQGDQEGGDWIVNGQKIWTSGAQYSRYGVVLTRTDPSISKYRGMTLFMIDMEQPGVEVRSIKQMDEGRHFNEVFFNDAVIPDRYRLGEVGGGWGGALTILMHERLGVSGVQPTGFPEFLPSCKTQRVHGESLSGKPLVRDRLAGWYSQYAGILNANNRMIAAVAGGGMPGAEASLGKLVGAVMSQEIANFMCQQQGTGGIIMEPGETVFEAHYQHSLLLAPGIRLAGGTDEIMRNIIAEQVLGLPQEPRADKGMAYSAIPSGNNPVASTTA